MRWRVISGCGATIWIVIIGAELYFIFAIGEYTNVSKTMGGEFLYQTGTYMIGITSLMVAGLGLSIPIVLSVWAQVSEGLVNSVLFAKNLGLREEAEAIAADVRRELGDLVDDAKWARRYLLGAFLIATGLVITLISIEGVIAAFNKEHWVLDSYKVLPVFFAVAIGTIISTLAGVLGPLIYLRQPNITKMKHQLRILETFTMTRDKSENGHDMPHYVNTYRRHIKRSTVRNSIYVVAPLLAVMVSMETVLSILQSDVRLYPRPSQIIRETYTLLLQPRFFVDVGISIVRAVLGFVFGATCAVLFGVVTGKGTKLLMGVAGILHILRAIPVVALVPLAITWLGIGWESKLALVFWGAFFPTWIATHLGVHKVNHKLLWVASTLGASGVKRTFWVALPAAIPTIITGARTGVAISFIALLAAEMTGTTMGIGYRITEAYQNIQVTRMIAYMLLLALLAAGADRGLAALLDWRLPWYRRMGQTNP